MECAENDGQGLGSDDRLSCHSRDDVLAPRTARAGLDAGDSGNGFGSRNRGVLTSQTGRATRLHEASPQERRWAHWTAIGTGSALRDLQLLVNSETGNLRSDFTLAGLRGVSGMWSVGVLHSRHL